MTISVSRETNQRLECYETLLRRWNPAINLIAPSTVDQIRQRHVEDCLQLSTLVRPESGLWADLGSGGGLPGIIAAILWSESSTKFTLVESDQRKSTFLRTVIRELGLSHVKVLTGRIEAINPLNASYISARALAPLPQLMPYLQRHLCPDGQAWLMKGKQWQDEVAQAKKAWKFNVDSYHSTTESGAAILKISKVSHG